LPASICRAPVVQVGVGMYVLYVCMSVCLSGISLPLLDACDGVVPKDIYVSTFFSALQLPCHFLLSRLRGGGMGIWKMVLDGGGGKARGENAPETK